MKSLKRILWVGFAAAILSGTATAQTTTGSTSTGSTSTGSTGGGSSGLGNASLGGSGGLGNNTNSSTSGNAVTITPPSQVQSTSSLNASNTFGRYYANPMYQGRAGTQGTSATAITNPGGFGTALYGNSGTSGGGAPTGVGGGGGFTGGTSAGGGFAGSTGTTGASGRTGGGSTGFGAATGAGGIGGSTTGFGGAATNRAGSAFGTTGGLGGAGGGLGNNSGSSQQNSGMISPRPIAYTATYRFPVAAIVPAQQLVELRAMVDASSLIAAPKNVEISTQKGGLVVLKGRVADEDESRLVEGMLRLTPGVRDVKNQLTFPAPTP